MQAFWCGRVVLIKAFEIAVELETLKSLNGSEKMGNWGDLEIVSSNMPFRHNRGQDPGWVGCFPWWQSEGLSVVSFVIAAVVVGHLMCSDLIIAGKMYM